MPVCEWRRVPSEEGGGGKLRCAKSLKQHNEGSEMRLLSQKSQKGASELCVARFRGSESCFVDARPK